MSNKKKKWQTMTSMTRIKSIILPPLASSMTHLYTFFKNKISFVKSFNFTKISELAYKNSGKTIFCANWIYVDNRTGAPKSWLQNLIDFYHLWPWYQWASSLIALVIMYWVTGYYYNKWLMKHGGWLTFSARVWLILFDLSLNMFLGVFYMGHRGTWMAMLMCKCPIALSPFIFILELICVYLYYIYFEYHKNN